MRAAPASPCKTSKCSAPDPTTCPGPGGGAVRNKRPGPWQKPGTRILWQDLRVVPITLSRRSAVADFWDCKCTEKLTIMSTNMENSRRNNWSTSPFSIGHEFGRINRRHIRLHILSEAKWSRIAYLWVNIPMQQIHAFLQIDIRQTSWLNKHPLHIGHNCGWTYLRHI